MKDKKICPFISMAKQGDCTYRPIGIDAPEPLYKNEDEMRMYGWWPIDGIPFSGLIPCLQTSCMAWQPGGQESLICRKGYKNGGEVCREESGNAMCSACKNSRVKAAEPGFCKLIR